LEPHNEYNEHSGAAQPAVLHEDVCCASSGTILLSSWTYHDREQGTLQAFRAYIWQLLDAYQDERRRGQPRDVEDLLVGQTIMGRAAEAAEAGQQRQGLARGQRLVVCSARTFGSCSTLTRTSEMEASPTALRTCSSSETAGYESCRVGTGYSRLQVM